MKPADLIENLFNEARAFSWSVALPESQDPRIQAAVRQLGERGICRQIWLWGEPTLSCNTAAMQACCKWVVSETHEEAVFAALRRRLAEKYPESQLRAWARSSLYQAVWLLSEDKVDSVLAGAVTTTAEVIRAGLHLLGVDAEIRTISGAFVLTRGGQRFIFSDCSVVIDPTAQQLAEIAASAATLCNRIFQETPRVAFLSFSTHGSARHPFVEKVQQAVQQFRIQFPHVQCEGELQGDAALDTSIRRQKAPQSGLTQDANVLIFPGLEAGNISYKLLQRLGGFSAYGPILLGFPKPLSDLSRGVSVEEIVVAACLNVLRGKK
jgi:phosphate acetyltransferase